MPDGSVKGSVIFLSTSLSLLHACQGRERVDRLKSAIYFFSKEECKEERRGLV